MVQDLTDVLCTAGKRSAVLPLFPFPPPIFPLLISFLLCSPPTAPLSHFLSHSIPFSSPSISPFIFASSIFPSQFVLLPLSLSVYPPPTVLFASSLYPLPKFLSSIFPSQPIPFPFPLSSFILLPLFSFPFFTLSSVHSSLYLLPFYSLPFSLSVCPLLLPYLPLPSPNVTFPFVPSFLYSLPLIFSLVHFSPFSLFLSHCLSPFTPSYCSLCLAPLPIFFVFIILIFPHNTSPSHSVLKAVIFSSVVIDLNHFEPFETRKIPASLRVLRFE